MKMLPKDTTIDCTVAGTPSLSATPKTLGSKTNSSRLKRNIGYFQSMYRRLTAAQTTCEMTVASATPKTPQPSLSTNTRSRMMFSTAVVHRKYSVDFESPSERRMEEMALYMYCTTSPSA